MSSLRSALAVRLASGFVRSDTSLPAAKAVVPHTPRALSSAERDELLKVPNSQRFMDHPPCKVFGTLLSEGECLVSVSAVYRLHREHRQSLDRRAQRAPAGYQAPAMRAERPNEVRIWDIARLPTFTRPARGSRPATIGRTTSIITRHWPCSPRRMSSFSAFRRSFNTARPPSSPHGASTRSASLVGDRPPKRHLRSPPSTPVESMCTAKAGAAPLL